MSNVSWLVLAVACLVIALVAIVAERHFRPPRYVVVATGRGWVVTDRASSDLWWCSGKDCDRITLPTGEAKPR